MVQESNLTGRKLQKLVHEEAVHRLNQRKGKGIARKQTKHHQQLLEPGSGEVRIYQKESSLLPDLRVRTEPGSQTIEQWFLPSTLSTLRLRRDSQSTACALSTRRETHLKEMLGYGLGLADTVQATRVC